MSGSGDGRSGHRARGSATARSPAMARAPASGGGAGRALRPGPQLLLNRDRLITFPAGVTKATGLLAALHRSASRHNATVGDVAERTTSPRPPRRWASRSPNAAPASGGGRPRPRGPGTGEAPPAPHPGTGRAIWAARQKHTRRPGRRPVRGRGRRRAGDDTEHPHQRGEWGGKSHLAGLLVEALSASRPPGPSSSTSRATGLRHLPGCTSPLGRAAGRARS